MRALRNRIVQLIGLAVVAGGLVLGQGVVAPASAVEVVADGGFEAAVAGNSPSWAEEDSSIGSPLCSMSRCGNGGLGYGPRTGTWWAWFGGPATGATGSLTQQITIPGNTTGATLTFWLWVATAPAPKTATLNVKIDSTVLQTFTDTTADAGYVLRTIDVTSFAPGPHILSFSFVNPGAVDEPAFHLDDVSINAADTSVPNTTITGSPAGGVAKSLSVPISFTATEPSTFSCTLDSQPAVPCTSPRTLKVTPGRHTFQVAATDPGNNADLTPASVTFTAYDCPTLSAAVTKAKAKAAKAGRAVAKAKKALKAATKSGDTKKVTLAKKKLKKAQAAAKAAAAAVKAAQTAAVPCG